MTATNRQLLDRAITEAEWQATIVDYARLTGWTILHIPTVEDRNGRHRTTYAYDGKGFPDLLLARERLIIAELKTERGRLTPEQATWLSRLDRTGVETHVWRPSDWDRVQSTLDRRSIQ